VFLLCEHQFECTCAYLQNVCELLRLIMSYWKHGFGFSPIVVKQRAMKYVDTSIKLSVIRVFDFYITFCKYSCFSPILRWVWYGRCPPFGNIGTQCAQSQWRSFSQYGEIYPDNLWDFTSPVSPPNPSVLINGQLSKGCRFDALRNLRDTRLALLCLICKVSDVSVNHLRS